MDFALLLGVDGLCLGCRWTFVCWQASSCTPLLRFLLEVIYECVLDSGLTLTALQSSQNKTGIYLAVSSEMDGFVTSQHCRTPLSEWILGRRGVGLG